MMKTGHVAAAAIAFNFLLCLAAFGQPAVFTTPGNVVIFEEKDFTGRRQVLTDGDNPLADFKPASIQVPAGLVAYLYEFVDAAGGFGISVDLMEDHGDLTEFGLSKNVSSIVVFATPRQGLIWVRNSKRNGEFVAGHWERPRATGNPVNPVAVASPPLPSRLPPPVTSIQQQGTTWTITTLGPQSPTDAAQWNRASVTMGVIGSDFRGPQEIGSAQFERASNSFLIPDWINFWYPNKEQNDHRSIVYFKRTLTGVITDKITKTWTGQVPDGRGGFRTISGTYELSDVPHVAGITGWYPDLDLNIDVAPFADYMYLIRDSHKPERSTEVSLKDLVDSDNDPCTDPFIKVETEIDAGDVVNHRLASELLPRVGKQIAMYGPWIYDIGHCDHPEIHPAEQIWWTEDAPDNGMVYHMSVVADASKRFLWRSQMDDGTKLHPWGAPPITGLFAIAFEVPVDTVRVGTTGLRFDVGNVDLRNAASVPGSSQAHNLVYQGKTLVSFIPHNDTFKVSFENVGLKTGGISLNTGAVVRGFLVIETTVGTVKQIATRVPLLEGTQPIFVDVPLGSDPDKVDQRIEQKAFQKDDGHNVFTLTRTSGVMVVR